MSKLTINLSFHPDNSPYPTGYWVATAERDGSPDYDGDGLTPLDAAMALATQMYAAIERARTAGDDA